MKFISYREKRNKEGRLIRRYRVYNFLLFRIKKKVLPVLGDNNKIIIGGREIGIEEKKLLDKLGKITIEGNNNIVELPDTDKLTCDIWVVGNNNTIRIGKFLLPSHLTILIWGNFNNRELIINDSKCLLNPTFLLLGNNRKIHVGKDCMFSWGIYIRNTDTHPIYDLETKERINEDKDIIIGDHVWIGQNAMLLKGSSLPSGSVIGAKSLVTKAFSKENCILAGIPAKVVKENIRWDL